MHGPIVCRAGRSRQGAGGRSTRAV